MGKGRKACAKLHYRFKESGSRLPEINLSDFKDYRHNYGAAASGFVDEALEFDALILSSVI